MPDSIVLVGLSGSGKSTIAEPLAQRLGRPLIDVDDAITEHVGADPSAIIHERGEAAFRQLEVEAVARACETDGGAVIATGGGAVIDPLNRWALWHAGTVAWLDAPDDVLLDRLARHYKSRPMLEGNPSAKLAALRKARTPFYRAADVTVDATKPVDEVIGAVLAGREAGHGRSRRLYDAETHNGHPMGAPTSRIVLGEHIDGSVFEDVLTTVSTGDPVVVADRGAASALPDLLDAMPRARVMRIAGGERYKRLRNVERLLEAASEMGAERGDAWIGVGGGTATDLVGTAAALYLRGVPFMAVPTTWLGMTDAAIGGKVAVDLPNAKNAAGAFWPPSAVVGDVASLGPLPRPRRLDGMAESLKSGIIGDPVLWRLVETRGRAALRDDVAARYAIIDRSVQLKLGIVERDLFERGERRTLNLGHTIGHALEVESGFRLPHGQAVVLGLRAVAAISRRWGADPQLAERIDSVAADLGFALTREFDADVVKRALQSDKKRHRGRQRWIMPMAVGTVVEVDDLNDSELALALATISGPGSNGSNSRAGGKRARA
jgi:3-dehydroquinate synthetase/shikimate kinase